jgi:hypothetical protein
MSMFGRQALFSPMIRGIPGMAGFVPRLVPMSTCCLLLPRGVYSHEPPAIPSGSLYERLRSSAPSSPYQGVFKLC